MNISGVVSLLYFLLTNIVAAFGQAVYDADFYLNLQNNSLPAVARVAAGYYADTNRAKVLGLTNTILVTAGNYGYLNHVSNFKCFADRLQLKFLVIAMELHTHFHLKNRGFYSYLLTLSLQANQTEAVEEANSVFRDKQFNIITNLKKKAVHSILELGYDVIFIDPDVAVLRDPLPYLIFRNVDYVHSLNVLCPWGAKWDFYKSRDEGNTGFYYVRSNNATLTLWSRVYEASLRQPDLDDQTLFWNVIRRIEEPATVPLPSCRDYTDEEKGAKSNNGTKSVIVSCHLDECLFSCGMLRDYAGGFFQELKEQLVFRNNSEAVAVHANFLYGNLDKQRKLQRHGLWIATQGQQAVGVEEDKFYETFANATSILGAVLGNGALRKRLERKAGGDKFWDGTCEEYIGERVRDGTPVKLHGAREVFLIVNGTRRSISNVDTFVSLGLDFDQVRTLEKDAFLVMPLGDTIQQNNVEEVKKLLKKKL